MFDFFDGVINLIINAPFAFKTFFTVKFDIFFELCIGHPVGGVGWRHFGGK